MLYYSQEIERNTDEILRAVKALQISDREKIAIDKRKKKTKNLAF